jgi:hypothetical protein
MKKSELIHKAGGDYFDHVCGNFVPEIVNEIKPGSKTYPCCSKNWSKVTCKECLNYKRKAPHGTKSKK